MVIDKVQLFDLINHIIILTQDIVMLLFCTNSACRGCCFTNMDQGCRHTSMLYRHTDKVQCLSRFRVSYIVR